MAITSWRALWASAVLSAALIAVSVTGRPAWALSLWAAIPVFTAALVLAVSAIGLLSRSAGGHAVQRDLGRRVEDETATVVMAAPVFPTWTPGIGRTPGSGHVRTALPELWPHAAAVVTVTDETPGRHARPRAYPVTPHRALHPAIAASLAAAGYTPHATAEDLLNSCYSKADAAMVRAITS